MTTWEIVAQITGVIAGIVVGFIMGKWWQSSCDEHLIAELLEKLQLWEQHSVETEADMRQLAEDIKKAQEAKGPWVQTMINNVPGYRE